jgi:diguanylate cyclase (GGDEF)-like protein/PAS domain S-box-containing protein
VSAPHPARPERATWPTGPVAVLALGLLATAGALLVDRSGTVSGWLSPAVALGAAALIAVRARRGGADAAAWWLLAAAVAAQAAGTAIYAVAGRPADLDVHWSAQAAWLAFYPLCSAAIVMLVRARMRALWTSLALDGVTGALTLAAISAALLAGPVAAGTLSTAERVGGIASLSCDVLLVGMLLWAASLGGRRGARMWLTLTAGMGLLLLADGALVADALDAGFPAPDLGWAIGTAGMVAFALAAWQPPAPQRAARADGLSIVILPAIGIVLVLGLLAVDAAWGPVPPTAHGLAIGALGAAALRAIVTYRQVIRLRESRRFHRGFEDASIGMALISRDLRWLHVNNALCAMLGRGPDELVGRPVRDSMRPGDAYTPEDVLAAALGRKRLGRQHVFLRPDGRQVETIVTSVLVAEGEDLPYYFTQFQDVTDRNRAMRHSAALAEVGRLAVDLADPDALVRAAMPVVAGAVGASASSVEPAPDAHGPDVIVASLRRRAGDAHDALVVRRPGGPFVADEARFVQAVADVLASALDRAEAEADMRRRALEDPLTGLPNRAFLIGHLQRELSAAARGGGQLVVMLLDIDRFKTVNDTFGHTAGDQLLHQAAARLLDRVRGDDVVARLGGDEFVVACGRLGDETHVAALAQRVVDAFSEPFVVDGRQLVLGASVGVAVATGRDTTPDALLRDADTAMYRAKERGGGRYEVFDAELRARVVHRLNVEMALREAIERGELRLEFQPVVALEDERLSGFEALLRWDHPRLGTVPPSEFVPIAEETDLIAPIGRWVLDRACAEAARWNRGRPRGQKLHVGVNLSPRELTPDIVPVVRDALERHGLDPAALMFEITERLVVQSEHGRAVVRALRAMGTEVALDDFGTGYSSLASLDELVVDVLKLDRSLIAGLGTSPRALGLVRAAVGMAEELGVRVLAEGLEHEAQVRTARALGCALGQGWFFSPALDAEDAAALAAEPDRLLAHRQAA